MGIRIGAVVAALALAACGGDEAGGGSSAARPAGGSATNASADAKAGPGAELYAGGCAACHGARGEGTQIASALNDRKRDVPAIVQAIQTGVATVEPPHTPMPARGDGTWSDQQVQTVAEYVGTLAR